MGGMRFVPDGTYRKRGSDERPPRWWHHYYRDPQTGQDAYLGASERLRRHREHRWYPADNGTYPQKIVGFVNGVNWLLSLYRSARDRDETAGAAEAGEVTIKAEG